MTHAADRPAELDRATSPPDAHQRAGVMTEGTVTVSLRRARDGPSLRDFESHVGDNPDEDPEPSDLSR